MEKIIRQNKDEIAIKYMVVTLFSWITLKKFARVEKIRKELKGLKEQENDYSKI